MRGVAKEAPKEPGSHQDTSGNEGEVHKAPRRPTGMRSSSSDQAEREKELGDAELARLKALMVEQQVQNLLQNPPRALHADCIYGFGLSLW